MQDNGVTMATQLGFSRWSMLNHNVEHWYGPISAAVYVTCSQASQLLAELSKDNPRFENATFHLVINVTVGTFWLTPRADNSIESSFGMGDRCRQKCF